MICRSIFSMVTLAMFMLGSNSLFAQDSVKVLLKTSKGEITLELDRAKAPVTSDNFVKYVKDGHYNGTIFHRVIPDFMAQGGGFTADMKEKETRAPIVNEASNGLLNTKYTVAMARTADPDSATAQFFINVKDNDFLNKAGRNAGYAVFGKVIKGTEVVNEIMKVKTASKGPHDDVPVEPIVIETAEVVEEAAK